MLLLYTALLLGALPQRGSSQMGLNSAAVPSLSILGAAKGGTTDLFYLMKDLHSGFLTNSRKVLDLAGIPAPFSASRARCALLSANITTTKECEEWLNKSGLEGYLNKYLFTIDACPWQYFYFDRYIEKYNILRHETGADTLFLLTLRDPVTSVPSLYNHWVTKRQIQKANNMTLETRLKKQFSLLEQAKHWHKLQNISHLVKTGSAEYDTIISLFSRLPRAHPLNEWLLRHIYIVGIMAYSTRVKGIAGNFLIVRSEHILQDSSVSSMMNWCRFCTRTVRSP